jgi:excisionase family DNA binding protein
MEELIGAAVERAVRRSLAPLLGRLSGPVPAVYTVSQAAEVLQVSEGTVSRLVRRGVLPRVPHVAGKVLIPKHALDRLADLPQEPAEEVIVSAAESANKRSISSAAARSEPGTKLR